MKALLEQRATDAHAAMVEMFTFQVRKSIGAFAAALGGIDTLVFTGGIGEHAASVRAECCAGLECLCIRVDPVRNTASAEMISGGSPPRLPRPALSSRLLVDSRLGEIP